MKKKNTTALVVSTSDVKNGILYLSFSTFIVSSIDAENELLYTSCNLNLL